MLELIIIWLIASIIYGVLLVGLTYFLFKHKFGLFAHVDIKAEWEEIRIMFKRKKR